MSDRHSNLRDREAPITAKEVAFLGRVINEIEQAGINLKAMTGQQMDYVHVIQHLSWIACTKLGLYQEGQHGDKDVLAQAGRDATQQALEDSATD